MRRTLAGTRDAPLHAVAFTDGHTDHAFGPWAFLAEPANTTAREVAIDLCAERAAAEPSLMANLAFIDAITWARNAVDGDTVEQAH